MGDKRRPKAGKKAGKRKGGAGYQSARQPKLRAAAPKPPSLPALARDDPQAFGRQAEDGLRVLAALETIASLEPDFSDDPAEEEASVTIIEQPVSVPRAEAAGPPPEHRYGSLRARLGNAPSPFDPDAEDYAAFAAMEEATVEIIGGRQPPEPHFGPQPDAAPPPHRLPVAQRVLRALKRGS